MASNCSLINCEEGEIQRNKVCFAAIRDTEIAKIVIESKKLSIERPLVDEYLNDLKNYFDFTWKFDEKEDHYIVDVSPINIQNKRVLLCMFIRFIWDGFSPKTMDDQFYKILPIYNKYKKYYSKRSRLELLLVSCNWFIQLKHEKELYINYNHFPNDPQYFCKLNINAINEDVNNKQPFMVNTKMRGNKLKFYGNSVENIRTKKEFCDFFNFVQKHSK